MGAGANREMEGLLKRRDNTQPEVPGCGDRDRGGEGMWRQRDPDVPVMGRGS